MVQRSQSVTERKRGSLRKSVKYRTSFVCVTPRANKILLAAVKGSHDTPSMSLFCLSFCLPLNFFCPLLTYG
uniref:Uncharacterized protein n=1 Tax=Octopus bimaculoides TaxID=37653 RepID=A0A0L8HF36_OCTBM